MCTSLKVSSIKRTSLHHKRTSFKEHHQQTITFPYTINHYFGKKKGKELRKSVQTVIATLFQKRGGSMRTKILGEITKKRSSNLVSPNFVR